MMPRTLPRPLAFALLVCMLLATKRCHAQQAPELWLNLGGLSTHSLPGRTAQNPALGLEWRTSPTWALGAGVIRNSHGTTSHYAGVACTPWHVHTSTHTSLHLGAQVGVVDGYPVKQGKPMPAAGLLAELRGSTWALAVVYVPAVSAYETSHTLAVQLKLRLGTF